MNSEDEEGPQFPLDVTPKQRRRYFIIAIVLGYVFCWMIGILRLEITVRSFAMAGVILPIVLIFNIIFGPRKDEDNE